MKEQTDCTSVEDDQTLGELLEKFINGVSHNRGRVLEFMAKVSVTFPQSLLLNFASLHPNSTPSSLARTLRISLPSISQMIERLVKLGLLERIEDASDRRRKLVRKTTKGSTLLKRIKNVRVAVYAAGTARLSDSTRQQLSRALVQALKEMAALESGS